jgi:hypothetical protein
MRQRPHYQFQDHLQYNHQTKGQKSPYQTMNIFRNRLVIFLVTLILALAPMPAFCQGGPPPLPPYPYLDSYSFGDTNFLSDYGYPPLAFTNLASVSVWDGDALLLDTTNAEPAYLNYRVVETNGFVNIAFPAGTMTAVFINTWASADTNQNGSGPGETGYLLAAGDFTSNSPDGLWGVWVDPAGTNLTFGGVSNGTSATFVSAPISWPSNAVHLLGIAYQTNGTTLYLDGAQVATGGPVSIVPATNIWSNGFFVGSDAAGYEQARAVFWDLEFGDSNCFTIFWSNMFGPKYFTNWWSSLSNQYYTWLGDQGGGFGFFADYSGYTIPPDPTNSVNTNFSAYTNFWLTVSNVTTNINVRVVNTLTNITYEVLTNGNLSNPGGWNVWQVFLASNSISLMPSIHVGSNAPLYFQGVMVSQTGTNGLPDWWQMQYFHQLGVDAYADPDLDGLCNLSEFLLGTNPTNAYSKSSVHTDAQALYLAYTGNDTNSNYQLTKTNLDTNTVLVTIWGTGAGTNYEIYSHNTSDTNGTWIVETNFPGSNGSTTVPVSLNGRSLRLIGGSGADSDGDGLTDGYEVLCTWTDPLLPDTGNTGVLDSYKDPDGDGYPNIVEYQNGTNPHVFNTPPAPTGVNVVVNTNGSTTISWTASPGATGYVVYSDVAGGAIATNSSSQTSFIDTSLSTGRNANYQIQTLFSGGAMSLPSSPVGNFYDPRLDINVAIVNGLSNRLYLVVSAVPQGVSNLVIMRTNYDNDSWSSYFYGATYPFDNYRWGIPPQYLPGTITNGTFSLQLSSFTNGIAQIPDGDVPLYGSYELAVTPIGANGAYGDAVDCWGIYTPFDPTTYYAGYNANLGLIPFIDGTEQMKENISFLLCATQYPFSYQSQAPSGDDYNTQYNYAADYVYSSYYDPVVIGGLEILQDPFLPFEDNYGFRNCVFLPDYAGRFSWPNTGISGVFPPVIIPYSASNQFQNYGYVVSNNLATIPLQLSDSISQWTIVLNSYEWPCDDTFGLIPGLYCNGAGSTCLSNGVQNCYGIPYGSFQIAIAGTNLQFSELSPGNCISSTIPGYDYVSIQPPNLQTVDYYFARFGEFVYGANYYGNVGTRYDTGLGDPLPGSASFAVTNTTPLMIMSVGDRQIIAGYDKLQILNGYSGVFAYLGQYFSNAYLMSNGVVTTNPGGIVSEYGNFYATTPGQIALLTKPDGSTNSFQGQCTVDVVALQVDVNRDGILAPTVTGPDFTGPNRPFRFWVNNNYLESGTFSLRKQV